MFNKENLFMVALGGIYGLLLLTVFKYHDFDKNLNINYIKNKTSFNVGVSITNNTRYPLMISGIGPGNADDTIQSGQTHSWESSEEHNTKSLIFKNEDGSAFMQGNLSFSQFGGVYIDRGWMQNQSIVMDSTTNGIIFNQQINGGKQVVPWDGFESGGEIIINFKG